MRWCVARWWVARGRRCRQAKAPAAPLSLSLSQRGAERCVGWAKAASRRSLPALRSQRGRIAAGQMCERASGGCSEQYRARVVRRAGGRRRGWVCGVERARVREMGSRAECVRVGGRGSGRLGWLAGGIGSLSTSLLLTAAAGAACARSSAAPPAAAAAAAQSMNERMSDAKVVRPLSSAGKGGCAQRPRLLALHSGDTRFLRGRGNGVGGREGACR